MIKTELWIKVTTLQNFRENVSGMSATPAEHRK